MTDETIANYLLLIAFLLMLITAYTNDYMWTAPILPMAVAAEYCNRGRGGYHVTN